MLIKRIPASQLWKNCRDAFFWRFFTFFSDITPSLSHRRPECPKSKIGIVFSRKNKIRVRWVIGPVWCISIVYKLFTMTTEHVGGTLYTFSGIPDTFCTRWWKNPVRVWRSDPPSHWRWKSPDVQNFKKNQVLHYFLIPDVSYAFLEPSRSILSRYECPCKIMGRFSRSGTSKCLDFWIFQWFYKEILTGPYKGKSAPQPGFSSKSSNWCIFGTERSWEESFGIASM